MIKRIFALFCLLSISLTTPLLHAENASSVSKSAFFDSVEEDDFLSPDQAFQLEVVSPGANLAVAKFKVEPGYYLYKQRIKFMIADASTGQITNITLPVGEMKNDPNFGPQEVYHHDFEVKLALSHVDKTSIKATYQGCSEKGLCYAPQTKTFQLDSSSTPIPPSQNVSSSNIESDDTTASNLLKSGQWWLIILGFFGAGLLLALTPCVFPMIPILSSIIIGKNAHMSRWKAFNLSLAYTLGMALTYTLLGIAAGLSGQLLSNALQTHWALSIGAAIFVLLALSMFGFYELKLPSLIENRFFNWSSRFKGGHLLSDFIMGVISALIISPCVAAPLAGALLYISKTNDVVLGGVALFSLSMGMGLPLLLIGASAGTVLPKVGEWMNAVRNLFGVLMLGVAVWLIAPIIPTSVQLALWAALLIVPAIYMHALDALPDNSKPIHKLFKGVALMMLVTGIAILIGALSGATSPLQPLSGVLANGNASKHATLNFKRIQSVADLNQQVKAAQGKRVMVDFYADWCVSCKEYEQFVFSDPNVQTLLKNTVLLQADVTANNVDDQALLKRFELFGPPGIIFFDARGQEITPKIVGYKNAQQFSEFIQRLNP